MMTEWSVDALLPVLLKADVPEAVQQQIIIYTFLSHVSESYHFHANTE